MAYFLINKDVDFIENFIYQIKLAKKNIHLCEQCHCIVENNTICPICANHERHQHSLCIVTNNEDLKKIESSQSYLGIYYVLNDECNPKNNHQLDKWIINDIIKLIKKEDIRELILATNWTTNGELTANQIKQELITIFNNLAIFRLAVGLPINSAINYADEATLNLAIKNKFKY